MHSRFFQLALPAMALLCASCSSNSPNPSRSESSDTNAPPNISPTAAPGVAFKYGYEFSLSDERIATTQEVHASACEKLGRPGAELPECPIRSTRMSR